jgi:hypothetical protein
LDFAGESFGLAFGFSSFSFENFSLKLFPVFGKVALLLFGLAHPLEGIVVLDHISQSGASPFVMEIWRNQHPYWGLGPGQLASRRYPRQREYPHPPPPSRNNTRRTINRVVISHLFPVQSSADWGPKPNVCEHKVETRGSRKLLGAG